jgi:hypothetical protein
LPSLDTIPFPVPGAAARLGLDVAMSKSTCNVKADKPCLDLPRSPACDQTLRRETIR